MSTTRLVRLVSVALALLAITSVTPGQDGASRSTNKDRAARLVPTSGESARQDALDKVLDAAQQRKMGLHKLNIKERRALGRFVIQALRARRNEHRLGASARGFMRNQGWEVVKVLGTIQAKKDEFSEKEDWMIVKVGLQRWAIEETRHFPKGKYWAKPSVVSGLKAMLDVNGIEHRFIIADSFQVD
jgi:hypothetical protein